MKKLQNLHTKVMASVQNLGIVNLLTLVDVRESQTTMLLDSISDSIAQIEVSRICMDWKYGWHYDSRGEGKGDTCKADVIFS
jgi:hypothetical protein